MKIKNIFLGFIVFAFAFAFTSCDDFLEEKPKENMDLGQFYKTAKHARSSINTLYNTGLITFYDAGVYNGATIAWGPYLSGLYDNEYKGQEVIVQYSQGLTISQANIANQMNSLWSSCYTAIARANTALKYVPQIEDPSFTSGEQDNLVAQAKFFRAFNYFHLVKFYGDVPLITEPYESLEDLYLPRDPSASVYSQIEKDLKEAIADLPDAAFVNNGFRVTKATAQTLLANVYMQMSGFPLNLNHYADAAAAAKSIITAGKHSLTEHIDHDQNSAYNILRTKDILTEYVFTRERSASITDYQNRWVQLSFPVNAAAWGTFKYTLTNNAIRPMPTLINAYNPVTDLRIKERQFFFTEYEDDKGEMSQFEAPSPWFYVDEEAMFETGISGKDFPIYRYAEVLLIAAEAIAQSEGVTAEAVEYLADVKARAFTSMTKEAIKSQLSSLSKEKFIEEVWAERIREFSLEMKIWDDIQRTRKYPVTSESNKGVVSFVDVIGAVNPWGATFQEKHMLWPITDQELQRNPELTQNPGYER